MQKEDSANLPAWAEFAAQDADGTQWAYGAHPNKHDHGWYENDPAQAAFSGEFRQSQNEVGRFRRLKKVAPNPDWERALIRIKRT